MMASSRSLPPVDIERHPQKGHALKAGSVIGIIAPASPAQAGKSAAGLKELRRLNFVVSPRLNSELSAEGYFSASAAVRAEEILAMANSGSIDGIVALRGGYGSNYILDLLSREQLQTAKCVIGFSDLTTLQIYLWQCCRWVTIHGPMVAAGLDAGAGLAGGYDEKSFLNAVRETDVGWQIALQGEAITPGQAQGTLLGGCMTLVEATLGTPWELDTRGAILVLEDRAMKPYQIDRVLMHFKQAGKFNKVMEIVLGEFPECEPPVQGSPTVRDVCTRILGGLGVPIVFGVPIGHTPRPMLTLPLGVKARLTSENGGLLEILEPAVTL